MNKAAALNRSGLRSIYLRRGFEGKPIRVPPHPDHRRSRRLAAALFHSAGRRIGWSWAHSAFTASSPIRLRSAPRRSPPRGPGRNHDASAAQRYCEDLLLTLVGIAIGSIASLVVARAISALLFGTTPTDPITFTAVMLMLGIVALFAGYLLARKALRIDPMVALRNN